jgi:hypothetical protein
MRKLLLITTILLSAIYAQSQNSFTQGAVKSYTVTLTTGNETGAVYSWTATGGTSTDLSAINGDTAQITWDGTPGAYTLTVQVTDGNGCSSEEISQDITIVSAGSIFFASAYPNTETCSDLGDGTKGSNPAHSQSDFAITYNGSANLTSAVVTIENPDGKYVGIDGVELTDQTQPEVTLSNDGSDKQIDFSVVDSWENTGSTLVYFNIKLISVITDDSSSISANSSADIVRTIGIRPKPVIQFSN